MKIHMIFKLRKVLFIISTVFEMVLIRFLPAVLKGFMWDI